ncbi:MAG: hypothetical protein BWX96_03115 [Bacteroidetes bacterium ADurb.Bin145]|jgi:hypothetical protein|nr:MAG: hypothetical protein BWX96_03115 [Bacteroidetes bacterium ADurb.Bin145]
MGRQMARSGGQGAEERGGEWEKGRIGKKFRHRKGSDEAT